MSLRYEVTPYAPYSPFSKRLNQFLDSLPLVSIIPNSPIKATAAAAVPAEAGSVKLSPSISVNMDIVNRYTMPPPTSIYQNTAS